MRGGTTSSKILRKGENKMYNLNQLKSLIAEAADWRNQEAQDEVARLLKRAANPAALEKAVTLEQEVQKQGGWRADSDLLARVTELLEEYLEAGEADDSGETVVHMGYWNEYHNLAFGRVEEAQKLVELLPATVVMSYSDAKDDLVGLIALIELVQEMEDDIRFTMVGDYAVKIWRRK